MPYTKQTWENAPATVTPISADRLNHMEDGIATAQSTAEAATGTQGPAGESAYQVAVDNGFVGTESEWLASLVGPEGPQGPQGIQGVAGADGRTVLSGSGVPSAGIGVDGDFYINKDVYDIYGPKAAGAWGAATSLVGPAGSGGAGGAVLLNGTAAPTGADGADGDFYIDTTTWTVYGPKASGVWPAGASMIGPQGPQGPQGIQGVEGPQGPQGPQGPAGADGADGADGKTVLNGAGAPAAGLGVDGDFYIDTTADAIYGPKTAGAWGAATSLVGPQGPQGPAGADGSDGAFANGVVDQPITFTSTVTAEQGITGPVGERTVTAADSPVTLTVDDQLVVIDATAGAVVINVPAGSTGKYAWSLWRKADGGANTVTITPNGTDTIDGATTVAAGGAVDVAIDGTAVVLVRSGSGAGGGFSGSYTDLTNVPTEFNPSAHAATHASGGTDPVTPAAIGAAPTVHTHDYTTGITGKPSSFTPSAHKTTHATGGTDALAASDIGAAAATHATQHASGGSDPVTPAAIGAAPTVHTHDYTTGITGKPTAFNPTAHASTHASAGSDPVTPAAIGAAPATHTHSNGQVADPVPFDLTTMGAAKTVTWTADRRLQFGTLNNATCTITVASIPDGGFVELIFTTSVASPAITFAVGSGTIVQMSPDILVPANSGSSVSFMVERRGTNYYVYKTGEHAA